MLYKIIEEAGHFLVMDPGDTVVAVTGGLEQAMTYIPEGIEVGLYKLAEVFTG